MSVCSAPLPRLIDCRRLRSGAVVMLLPLLAVFGCGGGGGAGTPDAVVSGKVTVNGKPAVSGAMVKFIGADGKETSGLVGVEGAYTVSGAAVGTDKVSVMGVAAPTVQGADMPGMGAAASKGEPIPAKYGNMDNGLTFTVKKGKQTFDIALTSP